MAFIAGIDLGLDRSACSYATMASSRLPINSARLPIKLCQSKPRTGSQDPYQSAARQPRSSLPFVVKLATAVVEVPYQAVAVHLEGHDAIACLLEAMDGESPLLTPVCDGYTDRSNKCVVDDAPTTAFQSLNSQHVPQHLTRVDRRYEMDIVGVIAEGWGGRNSSDKCSFENCDTLIVAYPLEALYQQLF